MMAFIIAVVIAVVLAVGIGIALTETNPTAAVAYSTEAVRLDRLEAVTDYGREPATNIPGLPKS
jgi:hypothetical protein